MLVLTRKAKQQIQIGPYVTITILQVKGQAVRVGIEAPKDVTVLRTELAERLAEGTSESGIETTIFAAIENAVRQAEINDAPANEQNSGRTKTSATSSLRCRAPRVDEAPLNSPYQSTGSASLLRPRRRRVSVK